MPSGYTAGIAKGITFETFIMSCAREFSVCATMRDDPSGVSIPEKFKSSDYNKKRLIESKEELSRLKVMSIETAIKEARDEYDEEFKRYEQNIGNRTKLKTQYLSMFSKAYAWVPPSKDHKGLKEFMLKQITDSIDFDCSTKYCNPPQQLSGKEWLNKKIQIIIDDIEYYAKKHAEEVKRVTSGNTWLRDLRESIK